MDKTLREKIKDIQSSVEEVIPKITKLESTTEELSQSLEIVVDTLEMQISNIEKDTLKKSDIDKLKPKDGKNGKDGRDGKDGKDGLDGIDGVDGVDGSPDTGKEIAKKLNELKGVIDKDVIKGLDFASQADIDRAVSILDSRTSFLINKVNNLPQSTGGGSLAIGSAITGATAWQVLYPDAAGDLSQDAGFIRNLTTGETSFSGTGQLDGSTLVNKQGDDTLNISGLSAPYEGNVSKTTNGDYEVSILDGHIDVSAFAAQPPGTFFAEQAVLSFLDSDLDESGTIYVQKLPAVFGGDITARLQIETGAGFNSFSGLQYDGTNIQWATRITDGVSADNLLAFSDVDPLEWRWGGNTIWKAPTTQGSAGDTLVLDTDNETLIWAPGGGGTPALTENEIAFGDASNLMTSSPRFRFLGNSTLTFGDAVPSMSDVFSILTTNSPGAFNAGDLFIFTGKGSAIPNVGRAGDIEINAGFQDSGPRGGNVRVKAGAGISEPGILRLEGGDVPNNLGYVDQDGSPIFFSGGTSTGTGVGGDLNFFTSLPGSTGDSGNLARQHLRVSGTTGRVSIGDIQASDFFTLPFNDGTAGQTLVTNGGGDVSWVTISSPILLDSSDTLYSSNSGYVADDVTFSNFFGSNAGQAATNASFSNFLGFGAGNGSIDASYSNFLGYNAGNNADLASNSNFLGQDSGNAATNAENSNFIGAYSGQVAVNASYSNFLGLAAGYAATDAEYSNFFGYYAGQNAALASNATFIGKQAGQNDTVDNTGSADDYSILIGPTTGTGGFSNSIAIGKSAVNTAVNQLMIGSATRPINDARIIGNGGIKVPVGTTGERIAEQGMIRYNTTTSKFEGYDGSTWQDFY